MVESLIGGLPPSAPVFSVVLITREDQKVTFTYTNWKGETGKRTAILSRMYIGSNEWHPEVQWLVDAWDVEKRASRTFALKDIRDIQLADSHAKSAQ